ncbi:hypothetical protein HYU72_02160, partial [Candidatus Berkelbacteria bacterium]|nr:hypothetical protein [Candidatus Berkelbacteria bacterium]
MKKEGGLEELIRKILAIFGIIIFLVSQFFYFPFSALATTYTKTWTAQADFESNAVTNDPPGTIGTPTTTRTNVNTSGTPGSVSITSVGATLDDLSGLG